MSTTQTQTLPTDSILEWGKGYGENGRSERRALSFWGDHGDHFAYVIQKVKGGYKVIGKLDIAKELMAREQPFPSLREAKDACQEQESEQFKDALKEGIVEVNEP